MAKKEVALTLKWLEGGSNLTPMQFFQKCIFYRERERERDRERETEITIFIDFLGFLTFP